MATQMMKTLNTRVNIIQTECDTLKKANLFYFNLLYRILRAYIFDDNNIFQRIKTFAQHINLANILDAANTDTKSNIDDFLCNSGFANDEEESDNNSNDDNVDIDDILQDLNRQDFGLSNNSE
ncbi:hypothetical protein NDA16_002755 [Ustilago loliicola]|nr:hypothetical protein NDA16_002755 [Ustilago loliicola]